MLTHEITPAFRVGFYLFIPPTAIGSVPSYRVMQLRTDGVHYQESAGTGPGHCRFRHHHGAMNVRLFPPTPPIGMKWTCTIQETSGAG